MVHCNEFSWLTGKDALEMFLLATEVIIIVTKISLMCR